MNIAVVCMTICPDHLIDWVNYHLKQGFCKIYLRLEGEKILETEQNLKQFSQVEVLEKEMYPMGNQMDRQCFVVNAAIERAREESHDFLLHIDDDELFYCERGLQPLLEKMNRVQDWDYLHFSNAEALYPLDTIDVSCFRRTEWFHQCSHTEPCRGYGNGKSMVRVDSPAAECWGVHFFKGKGKSVAVSDACILHFESCNFDLWKQKFSVENPSNFPFYKQSRKIIQQCRTGTNHDECDRLLRITYDRLTGLDSQPSKARFQVRHMF